MAAWGLFRNRRASPSCLLFQWEERNTHWWSRFNSTASGWEPARGKKSSLFRQQPEDYWKLAEQCDSGKQGRTTFKFSRLREEMTGELNTLVAFPGSLRRGSCSIAAWLCVAQRIQVARPCVLKSTPPGEALSITLALMNTGWSCGLGTTLEVQYLPSMCETLGLIPSTGTNHCCLARCSASDLNS